MFAVHASRHGHAFVDRALYLPNAWTGDLARLKAAHVSFAWVVADNVYGVGDIEMCLRRAGKGDGLGVNANSQFHSGIGKPPVAGTSAQIADDLDPTAWQRVSAGTGTKGERFHDWAYLELADRKAAEDDENRSALWTRGLLIRRNLADGERTFFSTWCPAGTSIETLVRVEGRRWAIEDGFQSARNELGLDHNETPSWHGWHRPVSLVMRAFAMRCAIRPEADGATPVKGGSEPERSPATDPLIRWSVQDIRRIACRLARRRIRPAHVVAWSLRRRAHQAAARASHVKRNAQL